MNAPRVAGGSATDSSQGIVRSGIPNRSRSATTTSSSAGSRWTVPSDQRDRTEPGRRLAHRARPGSPRSTPRRRPRGRRMRRRRSPRGPPVRVARRPVVRGAPTAARSRRTARRRTAPVAPARARPRTARRPRRSPRPPRGTRGAGRGRRPARPRAARRVARCPLRVGPPGRPPAGALVAVNSRAPGRRSCASRRRGPRSSRQSRRAAPLPPTSARCGPVRDVRHRVPARRQPALRREHRHAGHARTA